MNQEKMAELAEAYKKLREQRDTLLADANLDEAEKALLTDLNTQLDQLFTGIFDATRE